MAHITSLPSELLSNIFNKLGNLNCLAQCRLVCREWSEPAEKAMLGSTIRLSSNVARTRSLYAFLSNNSERAYLIKQLSFFDFSFSSADDCTTDLLRLALTTNLESITGLIWEDDFINTLTDIVEKLPYKLEKLTNLTLLPESPFRLALHCRDTIRTTRLNFASVSNEIDWTFADKLDEFTNLTSLELFAAFGSISNLDRILSKCLQLQKLKLAERHANLKMLSTFEGSKHPIEMLDYLLYKYPSTESISVNAWIDASLGEEYLTQIPQLLQNVPQRELLFTISEDTDIRLILRCLKNIDCKITVENLDLFNSICIKIDC
ncbi:hypothetical protein MBANPS3_008206 [Mucor bainieri]